MIKKEEELKCAMATIGLWNRGLKTLDNIIGSQQICSDKMALALVVRKSKNRVHQHLMIQELKERENKKFNIRMDFSTFLELVR